MAINRFSRGPIAADVQSKFIPLPIDAIDRQIQRRQSAYDSAKAVLNSAEENVYGVQGLSVDQETLTEITKKYDEDISQAVKDAGMDYSRLTGFADELSKKVSRDIKTGQLGAIQNNFVQAQNHMKDLTERYKKGEISESGYNKGLSSISAFGGTVPDGQGGYTRAGFYTPTKYLELGKTADEYGAKIRDQYLESGERYINAGTAKKHIYQNLYNNPQAIANAKEQVWQTYGDLDPEKESMAVKVLLANRAEAAANKIAFKQSFKADGSADKLTGGAIITSDIIGAKPSFNILRIGNQTLDESIDRIDNKGTSNKWSRIGTTALGNVITGKYLLPNESAIEANREIAEAALTAEQETARLFTELAKSDIVTDAATSMGIDLKDKNSQNRETLVKLRDTLNSTMKGSSNTRVSAVINEDTKESFENSLNLVHFPEYDIYDVGKGEKLSYDDKVKMLKGHRSANEDTGTGMIEYAGEIPMNDVGQPYPPGTKMFGVPTEDGIQRFFITPKTVQSKEFIINKINSASLNGYAEYMSGPDKIQYLKTNDGKSITTYKNGKRVGVIDVTR